MRHASVQILMWRRSKPRELRMEVVQADRYEMELGMGAGSGETICRADALSPYPLSLIPYPLSLIPYPLSLIPFPFSLFPFPFSLFPFPFSLFPFAMSLLGALLLHGDAYHERLA